VGETRSCRQVGRSCPKPLRGIFASTCCRAALIGGNGRLVVGRDEECVDVSARDGETEVVADEHSGAGIVVAIARDLADAVTKTVSPGPAEDHFVPARKLSLPSSIWKRSSIAGWRCGVTPPPGSTQASTCNASAPLGSVVREKRSRCLRSGSSIIGASTWPPAG
jgi:hypothetical protein